MEDNKPAKRITRSRVKSVETPIKTRNARSQKQKVNDENEGKTDQRSTANSNDDYDGYSSSTSSELMPSCKVVLTMEQYKRYDGSQADQVMSQTTRPRKRSELTEENVATLSNSATSRRRLRSESVASDVTESTVTRMRSARVSNSQNTPKKEASASRTVSTPARRSSRLLSGNDNATDSPSKYTPARRNLRSNSVISEDTSPPPSRTRSASRLVESQSATPKSLKTTVSKLKGDPTTPRRGSSRFNKSVMAPEPIDEEPNDNEEEQNSNVNTGRRPLALSSINEQVMEVSSAVTVKTEAKVLSDDDDEQKNSESETKPIESDSMKSPVRGRAEVLISTTTSPKPNTPKAQTPKSKAQTPTVESAKEVEESPSTAAESTGTPNHNVTINNEVQSDEIIDETQDISMHPEQLIEFEPMGTNELADDSEIDIQASSEQINEATEQPTEMEIPVASAVSEAMDVTVATNDDDGKSIEMVVEKSPRPTPLEDGAAEAQKDDTTQDILKDSTNTIVGSAPNSAKNTPKRKSLPSSAFAIVNVVDSAPNSAKNTLKRKSLPSSAFDAVNAVESAPNSAKNTPKRKSLPSSAFEAMNVTALAHEDNDESTPHKFNQSLRGMEVTQLNAETPVAKTEPATKVLALTKVPVLPNSKVLLPPKASEEVVATTSIQVSSSDDNNDKRKSFSSPFRQNESVLTTHINQIIDSLHTPIADKDLQSRFDSICGEISPGLQKDLDECFGDIVGVIDNQKTTDHQTGDEKQTEDKDVIVDDDNSESVDTVGTPMRKSQKEVTNPKSGRKSVQIMTPKLDKNPKLEKRIDTPYPDEKSLTEAIANISANEAEMEKRKEARASARKELTKLKESWQKSVKRNSISNDSPTAIDASNESSEQVDDQPAKKSVAARNNWAAPGLIDTESEPESEVDIVRESEESCEEEEHSDNFLDDGAEEVNDYNSGDSMDEDERQEIDDNKIEEEGMDLGSEDTDTDEEDSDGSNDDSFINNDEEHVSLDESDEEPTTRKRKVSRIIPNSSSDESGDEAQASGSNNAIAVIVQQVETVVVIAGNPPNMDPPAEGKTFTTTYLMADNEETTPAVDQIPSRPSTKPTAAVSQAIEAEHSYTIAAVYKPEEPQNEGIDDQGVDSTERSEDKEEQAEASSAVEVNLNEVNHGEMAKRDRRSLPSISALKKSSKKESRASLANMKFVSINSTGVSPRAQRGPSEQTLTKSPKATVSEVETPVEIVQEPIGAENVNLNIKEAAPLDISSQEENNNLKNSTKKGKRTETVTSGEVTPIHLEQEMDQTEHAPNNREQNDTTSSDNNSAKLNKRKSKRRFVEMDMEEEPKAKGDGKKLLKIICSASGMFVEEPVTPEKENKYGFKETPLTPVNRNFNVERRGGILGRARTNKRKSIYIDEHEAEELLLRKARWQISTQFDSQRPSKRARKMETGTAEVLLHNAQPKKRKQRAVDLIPIELANFRRNNMYRDGIRRQDARALLNEKYKRNH